MNVLKAFSGLVCGNLETVHLDLLSRGEATLGQQHADGLTLVPLQLNDLAVLWVLHHGAVAVELLLCRLHNLLEVILWVNALHCSQGLSAVSLLDTNVNQRTRTNA